MAQNDPQWSAFDAGKFKDGAAVGIAVGSGVSQTGDIKQVGQAYRMVDSSTPRFKTVINGRTLVFNASGTVVEAFNPVLGQSETAPTLMALDWLIEQKPTVKMDMTRAEGGEATMTSTTLRDQMAMQCLNAIMQSIVKPADLDDAAMFALSGVAYRWAEAMMRTAANYRVNEAEGSQETPDPTGDIAGAIDGLKDGVKIMNVGGSANPVPLTTLTKVENPKVYDEEEEAYVPVPLEVHVTGGGGGGGGTTNVNLDDLIEALGYDDGETTQAGKLGELIAAVTAAGKIKKADVSNVGDTQAAIDSVSDILVFSDFNAIVPYRVTPSQLANRMAQYDGLVERTVSSFPSALTLLMGSYYKLNVSPAPHAVTINLPAVSSDGMARIVMFHFSCVGVSAGEGGTGYSAFTINVPSGTVKKGRGSAIPVTLPDGTYEVDCVDNGSEWIVGVTEIVS